jgi:hypothetical protein
MTQRRIVQISPLANIAALSSAAGAPELMRAWLISNQRETPVSVPILACSYAIVIVGLEGSKRVIV